MAVEGPRLGSWTGCVFELLLTGRCGGLNIQILILNELNRAPESIFFFLRFYLLIFREQGREGEKHQCVVAPRTPPTGDLARNPGRSPDWESNQRPFGSQASAPSTEPHQPGLRVVFLIQGVRSTGSMGIREDLTLDATSHQREQRVPGGGKV